MIHTLLNIFLALLVIIGGMILIIALIGLGIMIIDMMLYTICGVSLKDVIQKFKERV